ncbi:beta-ketoacyl-ACP reductase [Kitasatospora herbaricolor]|nr:3-oxoacyl-[acyl-carrier protein] reductase [Kitasatospora herbaricolor]GGV27067.1 beta-ketoacyl-ACP reductase [Kitasatospora herbaricolor]
MSHPVPITDASRGVGLAIAQAYQAAGDRVVITCRSRSAPAGFPSVSCDTTQPDEVSAAFTRIEEQHGTVEVLVSNAGITRDKMLLTMTQDNFTSVLDTNLTGPYRVTKLPARRMLRRREGRILFISSASAIYGHAGQSDDTASKACLSSFARSLGARARASRGHAERPLPRSDGHGDGGTGRRGTAGPAGPPEGDRASCTVPHLAEAAYITGQALALDGGTSMGH